VRVRSARLFLSTIRVGPLGAFDGPYPQTKELSGGFTVVDVPTREAALGWAAKIAVACRCAQEVREFGPDPELYLRRRPRCDCRALFLRVTAPRQELDRCTVAWVVRAACDRAGLPRVGAHRLRHTAASQMLQAGASLPEIGQVLRHREAKTTAIYAKVGHRSLGTLARPWPGGPA
jgi:hypothetical protein